MVKTRQTGGGGANVIEWNDFLEPVTIDEKVLYNYDPKCKTITKGGENTLCME